MWKSTNNTAERRDASGTGRAPRGDPLLDFTRNICVTVRVLPLREFSGLFERAKLAIRQAGYSQNGAHVD
jgi:hypothetical protein